MTGSPPRTATQSTDATLTESRKMSAPSKEKPAYRASPDELARRYEVELIEGLSDAQAQDRVSRYGSNELEGGEGVSWVRVLVAQIVNAMVLVMIIAFIVSMAISSWIEGGVIAGVIVVNVVVGFMQQFSAEKTMDSLRSLASPSATVVRSSRTVCVASTTLVPGDIVDLKTGDVVPADLRLVDAMNFETDEALLTGESLPVAKSVDFDYPSPAPADDDGEKEASAGAEVPVGDRVTMAFSSSTVTKGRARGIVTATGMATEIGAIASSLQGKGSSRIRKLRDSRDDDDEQGDGQKKPKKGQLFKVYVAAYALTATDAIGRFLGVNVGTPLQRRLAQLAVGLFGLAVVLAVVVEAANSFSDNREIIVYAVATGKSLPKAFPSNAREADDVAGLSMIPASLIVVLTITFALGTKRMASRHVIVRKLDSLEALGAVNDICSDKTGTLTQGRMVARKVWVPSLGTYSLGETSDPFNPHDGGMTFQDSSPSTIDSASGSEKHGESVDLQGDPGASMGELLRCAALCNLARVFQEHGEEDGEKVEEKSGQRAWAATGDPTEIAIQVLTHRFNRGKPSLTSRGWEQLAEFPFSSDLKRMSVIYSSPSSTDGKVAFMKGAVERVLDACVSVQAGEGRVEGLEQGRRDEVMANVEVLAAQGLRVLALAGRKWEGEEEGVDREEVEQEMKLLGLVGIYDPPRPESKGAVAECRTAGIEVRMLTGDHPSTAFAIAKEIGIIPDVDDVKRLPKYTVVTAAEFDGLMDDEIDRLDELPKVIGRCAPQTKVRMIEALHRRKRFAAMTGDGVNDSPSLSRADVGIAMGTGSDVAKSASDIVLTDDDFASIIAAVEEGRRAFDNVQKFITHLLATNILQATVLMIGLAFKDQADLSVFPLSPVEVLWLVVVTAGPPAMGLGMERAAPDVMTRPPHDARRGAFTTEVLVDMTVLGLVSGAISLASFVLVIFGFGGGDLGLGGCNDSRDGCETVFRARSTCFATVCWVALLLAWELIDTRRSLFRMTPKADRPWTQWTRDLWSNQVLFWSVIVGFVIIFPLIYIPVINDRVFLHAPISWEWGICFIGALVFLVCAELWKLAKRVYFRRSVRRPDDGRA